MESVRVVGVGNVVGGSTAGYGPDLSIGSPPTVVKQKDPNYLGLFVTVHPDCPFTQEQIESDVRGEFQRARIKPTLDTDLSLIVSIHCLATKTARGVQTGYTVSAEIRYGTGTNFLYANPSYGKLIDSTMDLSFPRDSIKDGVASALTDYLKANFGGQ